MKAPLVTVLIPAKDEERWIAACLDSVVAQDYPHDMLEVVVVVDGASTDGTDRVAKETLEAWGGLARTEVVRCPSGGTPNNLNAGLAAARGEILCRVDARSRIPANYVRQCVEVLTTRTDVVVVGGAQVAIASRDDAVGVGIARALNNRFGMGWSRYRRGAASGPADTVYLGSFRTSELRAAGGWSSAFPTNQDFELNRRLAAGGTIWFDASIPVGYIPRTTVRSLHQQYVRFGQWKVRYWRRTGDRPQPRQLVLLAGVPVAGIVVATTVARSRHRALLGGVLVVAALTLEARGTQGPRAGLPARLTGVAALGAVATGWLSGAYRELAHPEDAR